MAKQKRISKNTNTLNRTSAAKYKNWFLDYASYVILERAVPAGRRRPEACAAAHPSCHEGDGRRSFPTAANIIGQSMAYHPGMAVMPLLPTPW